MEGSVLRVALVAIHPNDRVAEQSVSLGVVVKKPARGRLDDRHSGRQLLQYRFELDELALHLLIEFFQLLLLAFGPLPYRGLQGAHVFENHIDAII
ncbi:MAG: hypothetical protein BWZ01_03228 [Deltaproteobacteria bacterium ADurb.BinA179]|nr:MAG: hypothetical protein BWZ01_03228 [Deltaproteobacteria bacterium ADurb.BinA179]